MSRPPTMKLYVVHLKTGVFAGATYVVPATSPMAVRASAQGGTSDHHPALMPTPGRGERAATCGICTRVPTAPNASDPSWRLFLHRARRLARGEVAA